MSAIKRLTSRLRGAPVLTTALNLALIATIFLTRERWAAWVVERESLQQLHFTRDGTPDGRRILMLEAKTVRIWDTESDWVTSLCLDSPHAETTASPSGKTVVIEQVSAFVKWLKKDESAVWRDFPPLLVDVETGSVISRLEGHTRAVRSVAYSPDGSRIVTAGEEGTVRVWASAWGGELLVLRGHEGPVYAAAYSPDGRRIVTAGTDRTVRIWDARTGETVASVECLRGAMSFAAFAAGGRRVVAWCHEDRSCHVWDADSRRLVAVLEGADTWSCSPDGSRIVTTHENENAARIWDARTGALIATVEEHDCDYPSRIEYSKDGKRIMTCGGDRTIRVWDAETGARLSALCEAPGDREGIAEAEFTPDGSRVVTYGVHRERWLGRVWDAATGKVLAVVPDVRECCVLGNRRIVVWYENAWGGTHILRRIRPEQWWGVFWLPHLWVIAALAVALVVSGWRDLRRLKRAS